MNPLTSFANWTTADLALEGDFGTLSVEGDFRTCHMDLLRGCLGRAFDIEDDAIRVEETALTLTAPIGKLCEGHTYAALVDESISNAERLTYEIAGYMDHAAAVAARNIRSHCIAVGITPTELIARSGLSIDAAHTLLSGERLIVADLVEIAFVLGVDADALVDARYLEV